MGHAADYTRFAALEATARLLYGVSKDSAFRKAAAEGIAVKSKTFFIPAGGRPSEKKADLTKICSAVLAYLSAAAPTLKLTADIQLPNNICATAAFILGAAINTFEDSSAGVSFVKQRAAAGECLPVWWCVAFQCRAMTLCSLLHRGSPLGPHVQHDRNDPKFVCQLC